MRPHHYLQTHPDRRQEACEVLVALWVMAMKVGAMQSILDQTGKPPVCAQHERGVDNQKEPTRGHLRGSRKRKVSA